MSNPNIIALSAPVAIQAGSKIPSFEAVIYTGGELIVGGYNLPIVVDLAGLQNGKVLVANLDHDPQKRVGNFTTTNDGRTLKAKGTASAATPFRDEVVASAKAGYVWQASVEVLPNEIREVNANESVSVNGQNFRGPIYVTRKGTVKGFAFVSHGADDNTTVAIAAAEKRNHRMSQFLEWATDIGLDTSLMTAEQLATVHANFNGRTEANGDDRAAALPMIVGSSDPVAIENHRLKQIEAATAGDWGDEIEQVHVLKASAIGGEISVDQLLKELRGVRMQTFEASIPTGQTIAGSGRNNPQQVIEAALVLAGNINNPEKYFSEQTLNAADKMRGSVSLQQIILADAIRKGYPAAPGEHITQGNLHAVLRHAFQPIKATGFSTNDVSSITSSTANKFLLDGWNAADQTCLRIASIRSVKNFHQTTTVSLTGGTSFEQVAADGEIKHGTLGEQSYNNQVNTYGEILAITRQDIINDDLAALTAVPRRIGRAAMLKLNDLFWTVLLGAEATTFFAAGKNNLNTAAADVTTAGLNATFAKFLAQTDPDGKPLGLMPKIMLVPPTQHGAALALMNSQLVVTGASTAIPSGNPWQQRFTVETSPYMEISSYTGNSTTAWYLLADPMQLPTIEIAALNGKVEPTVETSDADFAQLGIQMRGYSDVGVALVEYRAAVKADGGSS